MNSHTHAIVCIRTTVRKAYIFALGHESTHSHKADKKKHAAERIHTWPWYAYVQISQDKEATKSRRWALVNERLAQCGTNKPLHLKTFLGFTLGRICFTVAQPTTTPSILCAAASPSPILHFNAFSLLMSVPLTQLAEEESLEHHCNLGGVSLAHFQTTHMLAVSA